MPISLAPLLRTLFPAFDPTDTKVHLAQDNGREHPLDIFHEGTFALWQGDQTKRNFARGHVLSLIDTRRPDLWLFAGLWRRVGEPVLRPELWGAMKGLPLRNLHVYDLQSVAETEPLTGRLHVYFHKVARGNYRLCETVIDRMHLSSLIEQPQTTPRFTGYRNVRLSMRQLRAIIASSPEDWHTALASVGGIYLLMHRDGRHYVGSATGAGGFWARWTHYAATGHAGNIRLMDLLLPDPIKTSEEFHFSILETADMNTPRPEVLMRETHWKLVLGARAIGLNAN